MIAKAQFKYGDTTYSFEVDEKSEMDTLHKIIVLANPPKFCQLCRNVEGFYFTTNKDKEGNTYINSKCTCGARSKLGQYKTGGYFWHDFEVRQKTNDRQETTSGITDKDVEDVDM